MADSRGAGAGVARPTEKRETNMEIRIDLEARAYYEGLAADITLRYPRLPMPGWDEAGADIQDLARDIARARGKSHRGRPHPGAHTRQP